MKVCLYARDMNLNKYVEIQKKWFFKKRNSENFFVVQNVL